MSYKDFYWITPTGEVIGPTKGEKYHYELIINNPELFGYKDKEDVLKFRDEHGSNDGGVDADSLRVPAIAQGFVRVRFRDTFVIYQCVEFNDKIRKYLKNFIESEKVYDNLFFQLKNVDGAVVTSGRNIDFFEESEIASNKKNRYYFPPLDTEEGREEARNELKAVNFDDRAKYKHFADGKFKFDKGVVTVTEGVFDDYCDVKFSETVFVL